MSIGRGFLFSLLMLLGVDTSSAAQDPPLITRVVNSLTGDGRLAPGSLADVFGSNLVCLVETSCTTSSRDAAEAGSFRPIVPQSFVASTPLGAIFTNNQLLLPDTSSTSVIKVNSITARVLTVSPTKVSIQIPSASRPGTTSFTVSWGDAVSPTFQASVAPVAPTLYTSSADPSLGSFQTAAGALPIDAKSPARPGQEIVALAMGLGTTTPLVADGVAAPSNPLAITDTMPVVLFDKRPIPVTSAYLAPGYTVVYWVAFTVPADAAQSAHTVSLRMTVGGVGYDSNEVSLLVSGGAVSPSIRLAPITLRPATLGAPYSAQFTATGGTGPYTYSVVGGSLPSGLRLDASGALSGTPSQLLPYPSTFTVQARDANGTTGQLAYTLDVVAVAGTTITGVRSASDFGGGFVSFASGSWVEIVGTALAGTTRIWDGADFSGGGLLAPTVLDGVRVFVNNEPAFVYYVSPTQLNVQAPADPATGPVEVRVTNSLGTASFVTQKSLTAPGLLAPSAFNVGGRQYLAAQFPDRSYVGRANLIPGVAFRPARPGDQITLYGIGFGEVSPVNPPGTVVTGANNLAAPLTISFGQTPAPVTYGGLAPGFLGVYQFNLAVPEVANGDSQINVTLGGQALVQPAMYLTVQR
jgi:uncharacterized protein (TIGR03437 family)